MDNPIEKSVEYADEDKPIVFNTFSDLVYNLNIRETEYLTAKKELKNEEIKLWFSTDWEKVIGKAKPSEKDKTKWIEKELSEQSMEVLRLELDYNHVKRLYETSLRYSFEILRG